MVTCNNMKWVKRKLYNFGLKFRFVFFQQPSAEFIIQLAMGNREKSIVPCLLKICEIWSMCSQNTNCYVHI